jgi:hypothetical protein
MYAAVLRKPQELGRYKSWRGAIPLVVRWEAGGSLSDDTASNPADADDHEAHIIPFGMVSVIDSVMPELEALWKRHGNCSGDADMRRMPRVAHLVPQIDARLVWLCVALVAIDAFFIAVYSIHRLYVVLYNDRVPLLEIEWNIEHDWSYAEIFGYVKSLSILLLFISTPQAWKRPIYLVFVLVFTFVFVDDALQVHERLGLRLEEALALRRFDVLMRIGPGQLLVWAIIGLPLLAVAVAAVVRSPEEDRRNGILLMGALAVLALFAVGIDMVHVLLRRAFRGANELFIVIEDGGEQIILSLILCLVILIRRDLRGREPRSGTPA